MNKKSVAHSESEIPKEPDGGASGSLSSTCSNTFSAFPFLSFAGSSPNGECRSLNFIEAPGPDAREQPGACSTFSSHRESSGCPDPYSSANATVLCGVHSLDQFTIKRKPKTRRSNMVGCMARGHEEVFVSEKAHDHGAFLGPERAVTKDYNVASNVGVQPVSVLVRSVEASTLTPNNAVELSSREPLAETPAFSKQRASVQDGVTQKEVYEASDNQTIAMSVLPVEDCTTSNSIQAPNSWQASKTSTKLASERGDDRPFDDLVKSPSTTDVWKAADNLYLALLMCSEKSVSALETARSTLIPDVVSEVDLLTDDLEKLQLLQNTYIDQESFIEAEKVEKEIRGKREQLCKLKDYSYTSPFEAYMSLQTKLLDVAASRYTVVNDAQEQLNKARYDIVREANERVKREALELSGSVEKLKFECDRLNLEASQIEKQYATIDAERRQVEEKISQQTQQFRVVKKKALMQKSITDVELAEIRKQYELKLKEQQQLQATLDDCEAKIQLARSKFQKQLGRLESAHQALDVARQDVAAERAQLLTLRQEVRESKEKTEKGLLLFTHEIAAISVALLDIDYVLRYPAKEFHYLRAQWVKKHTSVLDASTAAWSSSRSHVLQELYAKRKELEKCTLYTSQTRQERILLQRRLDEAALQKKVVVASRLFREAAALTQEIRCIEANLETLTTQLETANESFLTLSADIQRLEEEEKSSREEAERWNRTRAALLATQVRTYAEAFVKTAASLSDRYVLWEKHRENFQRLYAQPNAAAALDTPPKIFVEYVHRLDELIKAAGFVTLDEKELQCSTAIETAPFSNGDTAKFFHFCFHPLVKRIAESAKIFLDDFSAEAAGCEWWNDCCAQWEKAFRICQSENPETADCSPKKIADALSATVATSDANGFPNAVDEVSSVTVAASDANGFPNADDEGSSATDAATDSPQNSDVTVSRVSVQNNATQHSDFCSTTNRALRSSHGTFSLCDQLEQCIQFLKDMDALLKLTLEGTGVLDTAHNDTKLNSVPASDAKAYQKSGHLEGCSLSDSSGDESAEKSNPRHITAEQTNDGFNYSSSEQEDQRAAGDRKTSSLLPTSETNRLKNQQVPNDEDAQQDDLTVSDVPLSPPSSPPPPPPVSTAVLPSEGPQDKPIVSQTPHVNAESEFLPAAVCSTPTNASRRSCKSEATTDQVRDEMLRALELQVDEAVRQDDFEKAYELDKQIEALKACIRHPSC